MPYQVLALDLDDTLLREDLTISERTRRTLLRAQEAGTTVVLASGRPTGAMVKYARDLELARFGGFLISFNGAVVTDCRTGETLFEQNLSKESLHELHDLSQRHRLFILSYRDNKIVTPRNNPYTEIEAKLTGMPIHEVADFKAVMDGPATKVILLEEPTYLKATSERIRPVVEGRMNMTISKPFFLEFMDRGIDKRKSLEFLVDRLGLGAPDVMAIGDSYNDLGMLTYAGLGVCMANGREEVRAMADAVTASNEEDGVAEAVDKYLLAEVTAGSPIPATTQG
jgi:Cof subfamily protein (haloacid dehalogenase superfamily)